MSDIGNLFQPKNYYDYLVLARELRFFTGINAVFELHALIFAKKLVIKRKH